MHVILVVLLSFALAAETLLAAPPAGRENTSSQEVPSTLAISADWMNGSVSLLSPRSLLAADGSFDDALIERIPLSSSDQQGPLTLLATPDGKRVVVLRSLGVMGFVGARLGLDTNALPDTGGAVMVLDLETREVVAEFPTTDLPIMAALDVPRNRVFVSFLGSEGIGRIVEYDLDTLSVTEGIDVAPFVEGLAINDAGTRGAVIGAVDGLYLFDPADLAGSLSKTPLKLSADSSGVTFISGSERLVVANSVDPRNYVVVDASDLNHPSIIEEGGDLDGTPFMIAAVPNRQEVVFPIVGDNSVRLIHLDVSKVPARSLHEIDVQNVRTFPQAVTVSPDGRFAFVGAAGSKELLIFDLANGEVQRKTWLDEPGPTSFIIVR